MATLRQTSFAAGELSPLLWGRTDLEMFGHGARKLLNFFVNRQGAAVSRPGTKLLVKAKTADVVLVPFVYSDTASYVLELGAGYLRVHDPATGYTGTELATPWAAADLPALQWAQTGGSLYLTHQSYAPKEVLSPSALTGAVWLIRDARFSPPGDTPSTSQTMLSTFRTAGGAYVMTPLIKNVSTALFVKDAQHPAREWKWKVSALLQHNVTGQVVETVPDLVTEYFDGFARPTTPLPADNLVVLYPDAPVLLRHPGFGPLIGSVTSYANWTPVGQIYYRGRGTLYGYVGESRYAQDFVDVGDAPDYLRQPLRGESPFPYGGEAPAAVAFFQQRLIYAGTSPRPATLWASAIDGWANFDAPKGAKVWDDMPLEFTLAARRRERIRSMVAINRLLLFTDSSVWSLGAGQGSTGFGADAEFRVEDEVGATSLQPLIVDGAVLYVRAKGRGVRALQLSDSGQYQHGDVTWQAEHLFRDPTAQVRSWCFARDPWGVVWAAREDGVLLSCTHTGAGWAWAKHTTGSADRVRSVVCVPGANSDQVFLAVERVGGTYIERMMARDRLTNPPANDATTGDGSWAVDSHVIVDGLTTDAAAPSPYTFPCTGLAHLEGRDVWAVAPGNAPQGPLRVTGGQVSVGPFYAANFLTSGVRVAVGLAFTDDLELLDAAQARLNQKTTVRIGLEVDSAQGLEAGEDFDHLVPWKQRSVQDSYEFPSAASLLVTIDVKGAWRKSGRAVLRQAKPLPVTVLGVTREVDSGG